MFIYILIYIIFLFFFLCWTSGHMLCWLHKVPHRYEHYEHRKCRRPRGPQAAHKICTRSAHTQNEHVQAINVMHFISNTHATNFDLRLNTFPPTPMFEKAML